MYEGTVVKLYGRLLGAQGSRPSSILTVPFKLKFFDRNERLLTFDHTSYKILNILNTYNKKSVNDILTLVSNLEVGLDDDV